MQIDPTPLRQHIAVALGGDYEEAKICPAMEELYRLLGASPDTDHEAEAASLLADIPGTACSRRLAAVKCCLAYPKRILNILKGCLA